MQIVEPDQVDILAFTVPRDLQQIADPEEAGLARELRRNLCKFDGLDGVDFYLAFVHPVAATGLDVGTSPDPNAAGNVSPADSFAQAFREDHGESLHQIGGAPVAGHKIKCNFLAPFSTTCAGVRPSALRRCVLL